MLLLSCRVDTKYLSTFSEQKHYIVVTLTSTGRREQGGRTKRTRKRLFVFHYHSHAPVVVVYVILLRFTRSMVVRNVRVCCEMW